MDKRNSFIQKGRDGKQKRSRSQKVVSIYRYPFSGVGCRIFPRSEEAKLPADYSADRSGHGRGREGGESTIPEREIRYETDDNEFKFASTKKARCTREIPLVTRPPSIANLCFSLFFPWSSQILVFLGLTDSDRDEDHSFLSRLDRG